MTTQKLLNKGIASDHEGMSQQLIK
jgi:hypothetical protein